MRVIPPKIIITVTVIAGVFILISLAQEMNRRMQVQREVARLRGEVNELEKSVVKMENLNQYFRTDDFQERMAREKLNYKAKGEKVVLIPDEIYASGGDRAEEKEGKTKSNPLRWWQVFFAPREGGS